MKKVDLNFQIKGGLNERGQPVIAKANEGLANLLETSQLTDEVKILKYFNWALQLKTTGILEMDAADILDLKKFVLEHPHAFVFFKQPVLNALSQPPVPEIKLKNK